MHVVVELHYVQLGIKLLHKVQRVYEGRVKLSKAYVLFMQAVQVVKLEHKVHADVILEHNEQLPVVRLV